VFSRSKARRPGVPRSGATRVRPARADLFGVPARAVRPLAVILGCTAAVAVAGCKPGVVSGASSGTTPSATAATAAAGAAGAAPSAASVIAALASNAPGINSLVATLQIHATGSLAAGLTGTLTEQMQPSPLVEVRTTVPSGLEAVLAGDMAYLKLGALAQAAGKPWIEAPISGLESSTGASIAPMIQQLQASDPLAQIQMFTAATNVRDDGTSTIDGAPATRYSGSYPLAAGLAKLGPVQQSSLQSDIKSSGITTTQFTVWVDTKNQVRKISLVEYGKSTQIDVDLVIVSLNPPVQISIPPASEVAVAAGVTSTPAPAIARTPAPAISTPKPVTTSTPAPGTASTPTPVPSSPPTSAPTSQPHHW
jgi:hypothetical protein